MRNTLKFLSLVAIAGVAWGQPSPLTLNYAKEPVSISAHLTPPATTTPNASGRAYQVGSPVEGAPVTLKWRAVSGRYIGHTKITTASKGAVRVHLSAEGFPADAVIRMFDKGGSIIQSLPLSAYAEGKWSPSGYDFLGLEVDSSEPVGALTVKTGSVSRPGQLMGYDYYRGKAPVCTIESACRAPSYQTTQAIAYQVINSSGGGGGCSGTYVSDTWGSRTAYILTARHCLGYPWDNFTDMKTVAKSAEVYWFFESNECNNGRNKGNPPAKLLNNSQTITDNVPVRITAGAELLFASDENDVVLMALRDYAPKGAKPVPVATKAPPIGAVFYSYSHPALDIKKAATLVSQEYLAQDFVNNASPDGQYYDTGTHTDGWVEGVSNYVKLTTASGMIYPGSSGSSILHGGAAFAVSSLGAFTGKEYEVCLANPIQLGTSWYGVAHVHREAMRQWLEPDLYTTDTAVTPAEISSTTSSGTLYATVNVPMTREYLTTTDLTKPELIVTSTNPAAQFPPVSVPVYVFTIYKKTSTSSLGKSTTVYGVFPKGNGAFTYSAPTLKELGTKVASGQLAVATGSFVVTTAASVTAYPNLNPGTTSSQISNLRGYEVYVGYGISLLNMLQRRTYRLVATTPQ